MHREEGKRGTCFRRVEREEGAFLSFDVVFLPSLKPEKMVRLKSEQKHNLVPPCHVTPATDGDNLQKNRHVSSVAEKRN